MPVQIVSHSNNLPTPRVNSEKQSQSKTQVQSAKNEPKHEPKVPTKVKFGVFCTTFAGVATAMAITLKSKGRSLNPARMFKTNPKNWAIFHIKYSKNKNDYDIEKLVGRLALGSVGGGLIGGAIFDKKENMKAKYRESIIQLIGNISTPLFCVAGGMRVFDHFEPKILNSMKFLKGNGQKIPGAVASAACLTAGIFLGNKVGNTINEKAFGVKDNRKIKLADMSPHIDDLCLAITLVAAQSNIGPIVSRIIPAALMVAGVSTGIAQERPDRLATKRLEEHKD